MGTTTACYFGTIHVESTKILANIIHSLGQRAFIGKVCMDQHSPQDYIEPSSEASVQATLDIIDHISSLNSTRITPVITPRFVPTCSSNLLRDLGALANLKNLPITSHISETIDEIAWVKSLHPDKESYAHVYDSFGLLNARTIMAHCIHLSDPERALVKTNQVGISHCPSSNFCLQSGVLNVRRWMLEGVDKIGLGTDVGGGYDCCILDAIRQALTASKIVHMQSKTSNSVYPPLTLEEAFYMATLGGARVMNLQDTIGNFVKGKALDAILVDLDHHDHPIHTFPHDSLHDKFEKFLYLGDDRHLKRVFVGGDDITCPST